MDDKRRREASYDLIRFVKALRRGNGRHVSLFGDDPPAKASVERTRAQILDAFFVVFPQHREFRPDLSTSLTDRLHSFVADSWNEVTRPTAC